MFLDKEHSRGGAIEFSDEVTSVTESTTDAMHVDASDNDLLLSASEKEDIKGVASTSNGSSAYHAPLASSDPGASPLQQSSSSSSTSSSAIDDLLGLGVPIVPVAHAPLLTLTARPVLSPADFQLKWKQLPITSTQVSAV
jgi:hypothetical protein